MDRRRSISAPLLLTLSLLLAACGPQLGNLQPGETGRVVRAYGGDTLVLDSGLRVFLAEIDAPRGEEDYASQAQGELEALALHRNVRLAYGGTRRWIPRDPAANQQETAIAHVFVQSEGGRWFWLQHEMVARGGAFVRPARDNHARTGALFAVERDARRLKRGLWSRREFGPLNVRSAARQAVKANAECLSRYAPYRVLDVTIGDVRLGDGRATLAVEGMPAAKTFSIALFGEAFTAWDGPDAPTLTGAHVLVRGPLAMFDGAPQLCLDNAMALEVLSDETEPPARSSGTQGGDRPRAVP